MVLVLVLLAMREPTAVQAVPETHDTLARRLPLPRLGLGTFDQRVPSQDSISVLPRLLAVREPVAMHAVAETHDTPSR